MLKTADDIRSSLYPNPYSELVYERTLLTSEVYLLPSLQETIESIKRNSVQHIPFSINITECEKSAWYLTSNVHLERSLNKVNIPKEQQYSWAFGWAIGMRTNVFGTESHTMCIVITSDFGIQIIEPKSNLIEDADTNKFNVFWVVM